MYHKHMFSEIHNENGFSTEALYLTVNKKLTHSYKQFGLRLVSKKLENDIKWEILTNLISPSLHHSLPFWNVKRAEQVLSKLSVSTFSTSQTKCKLFYTTWIELQKKV